MSAHLQTKPDRIQIDYWGNHDLPSYSPPWRRARGAASGLGAEKNPGYLENEGIRALRYEHTLPVCKEKRLLQAAVEKRKGHRGI